MNEIETSFKALERDFFSPQIFSHTCSQQETMDCSQLFSEIPPALTHFWKRSWFTSNCLVSIQHIFSFFQAWMDKLVATPQSKLRVWPQMQYMQTVWQVPLLPLPFCFLRLAQLCAQVNKLDLSEWKHSNVMKVSFLLFSFIFFNGSHHNFFFPFLSLWE